MLRYMIMMFAIGIFSFISESPAETMLKSQSKPINQINSGDGSINIQGESQAIRITVSADGVQKIKNNEPSPSTTILEEQENWLIKNMNWIFSGIGGTLLMLVFHKKR